MCTSPRRTPLPSRGSLLSKSAPLESVVPRSPCPPDCTQLEEFPGDVEADVPVVVAGCATSDLSERGAEAVGYVQLKEMAAGTSFESETHLTDTRVEAPEPRGDLGDEVGRGTY